jgi:hypothetical protein
MKTIKKIPVTVEFVDEMPFDTIQDNVLYVDKKTCRIRHNCLCGCDGLVDIPLSKINDNGKIYTGDSYGWDLDVKGDKVTITPSILNLSCNGHYIVTIRHDNLFQLPIPEMLPLQNFSGCILQSGLFHRSLCTGIFHLILYRPLKWQSITFADK